MSSRPAKGGIPSPQAAACVACVTAALGATAHKQNVGVDVTFAHGGLEKVKFELQSGNALEHLLLCAPTCFGGTQPGKGMPHPVPPLVPAPTPKPSY